MSCGLTSVRIALAAGEREAALAHDRVVALGQLGDEAGGLRALGGALDLLARRVGSSRRRCCRARSR